MDGSIRLSTAAEKPCVTLKGGGCIVIEAWILEMSARWDVRFPLRKVAGTKYWPDTKTTNATGDRTVQWTI